jgi:outer membrane protein TolC
MAQIDRTLARNSLLPQLDALWFHGDDRGAGGIGPVRRIGLELSVPLFFRSGRGQIRQANLSLERLDWLERALKLRIVNEVRDAASALETDAQRLDAARQEASLASELERAERAAFELGDSTLFPVNQRERAAAEAATRSIEVRCDYEVSRIAFLAAQGDL